MDRNEITAKIAALPKAELHVHLEGAIRPEIGVVLAGRHGVSLGEEEVRRRYAYSNFMEFIEAFKWVTSFLRTPSDFALLASDLARQLLAEHVVYAEVTLSVGVMLLRQQNPQANFEAILAAVEPFEQEGLRLNWIFDAVRQFGPDLASQVVDWAKRCNSPRIVAFGIGGDELSIATKDFDAAYKHAADCGLHRVIHSGEIGGPEKIREAVEYLGVERVGHGIAAVQDPALMDLLAARRVALEVCPVSNLRTGALAKQLGVAAPSLREHPLPQLLRHGIPTVLSTDDPAMFHTSLEQEYRYAHEMGLTEAELRRLVTNSFDFSFPTAIRDEA
ncbi:MAG TPA: adenosine deaminase [Verrucomicrobiae bacterium]|nr:adenosine deaminase [Verrucomicrobiae bacterium]